jgi:hemoglobin
MLADPIVKDFFKDTDMTKQRQRQTQFITMATGGPHNYEGLAMKPAHEKFAIGHK